MATDYKTIQPKEYYEHFLKYDVRPDKREMNAFRSVCVDVGSVSTANGSALVKLDKTIVLCGIKGELSNPLDDEPTKGFIVPNVDLPSLCCSRFRPGPPTPQAQIYSQQLLDIIKNSDCIDTEDLCIVKGKLCWCLFIDVTCLNYDGNILDASVISVMAALKNTKIPEISVSSEDGSIKVEDDQKSLKVNHFAFSATFTLFNNTVIADPTSEEENLAEGIITIFTHEDGSMCGVTGSCSELEGKMSSCILLAKKRTAKLTSMLKRTVTEICT